MFECLITEIDVINNKLNKTQIREVKSESQW